MTNKLNKKIWRLWEHQFATEKSISPTFFCNESTNQILFIGLNPSFSERGFRKILFGSQFEKIKPKDFFDWQRARIKYKPDEYIEICNKIEQLSIARYGYFSKLNDISPDHVHIDLFFYRETSQKNFKQMIFSNGGLSDFAKRQLDISFEMLRLLSPKVIVVINALSREIICEHYHSAPEWDDHNGFHWIKISGRNTPIFFSSMLSGQRALDNGSFERLKWHIRHAIKAFGSDIA